MSEKIINIFKTKLIKELKEQIDWYEFDLTHACKEWINNVAEYYSKFINTAKSPDEIIAEINENKNDEKYEINWPNEKDANKIIAKAQKSDPTHFPYIIEHLGLSNSAKDCFYGEWEYNIRPEIMNTIYDIINDLNE